MKSTILRLTTIALFSAAVMTGCNKDKDFYDPTWGQEQAEQAYASSFDSIFGEVNSSQDWSTVTKLSAQITVRLGLTDNYTVGIFNSNPLVSGASMLAVAIISEGVQTNIFFDAPASQNYFFVGVYDGNGHMLVKTVPLTDGKLVTVFSNAQQSKASTRATEDEAPQYARTAADYLTPVIDGTPATALTIEAMEAYPAINDDIIANETNDGNHTLSDISWYYEPEAYVAGGDGKHYRIDAETEVTEPFHINGEEGVVNDAVIYIQGKVHLKGNTLNGVTLVVADGGEIILDTDENHLSNAGRIVVLAGGKITASVSGAALNVNNGQWNYNAGTIDFDGTLNLNGSNFYNCGTVNVDVITGTADGSLFTNFGHITARTNRQQADSYNCQYINACYLQFTEDAALGGIVLLNNSRVDIGRNAFFNGTNQMGNASAIIVGGSTTLQTDATFNGPTGDGTFSVFKPNKILVSWIGNGDFTGNIYVDWVETECYDFNNNKHDLHNQWSAGYLFVGKIDNWVVEATAPEFISIPEGECTGAGYNVPAEGRTPVEVTPPTTPNYYTIAFEDLGSNDDFDFNDIVLYVAHDVQSNKATVQLMAAGGTIPVNVLYNGEVIMKQQGGLMSNTARDTGFRGVLYTVKDLSMTDAFLELKHFSIEVLNEETSIFVNSSTLKGRAPQALIIPGRWAWPTERTRITDAYPHFAEWIKGVNDNGWYTEADASKVISSEK